MAQKTDGGPVLQGTATHRRTEGDYLRAMLDAVTLDDWRDVVANTLQAAKQGDAAARGWLGQYLVGKPATNAPSPLTVVVQQLGGNDPVVDRLATPLIARAKRHILFAEECAREDQVRAAVAAELAEKLAPPAAPAAIGHADE